MSITKTAAVVLSETEAKLRELVGRAAAEGDYDLAVQMATTAKNVAAMALSLDSVGSEPGPVSAAAAANEPAMMGSGVPRSAPVDGESASGEAPPSPARARSRGQATPRRARRREAERSAGADRKRAPRKGQYPRFYRDGDFLVKVSWSKKDRGEYQHKAPRRVAELLAAAIGKRSGNGRLFTSEDLFPLRDPQGGGDVPSYQAYAALAWFRAAGLVRPHGRRGYTVKRDGRLSELMTTAWRNLSESSD